VSGHETDLLGAYVLGVLDRAEQATVQEHLDGCAVCRREVDDLREMEAALGEIPPEAFLEGPPPDGDLLLQKTLQQVRAQSARLVWRNRLLVSAAAVLLAVIALAAGTLIGRRTAPAPLAAAPASASVAPFVGASAPAAVSATSASASAAAPAVRTGAATDAETGVSMTATVRPAAGWVRVNATVTGVPGGEECRLFVIAADGSREPAGSWLSSATGSTTLDGAALMAPDLVTGVQAETYAGQILVAVPI
jgi:anti-sigma factor RsiW